MPKVQDWHRKLAIGEAFERRMITYFEEQGHMAWKPTERTYDLRINMNVPFFGSVALNAECKYDAMAASTKRLALQTFDGGRPRGIHPSGPCPDLWIHGVEGRAWIIKTKILQGAVEQLGLKAIAMGDKGMRAKGVLMPLEQAQKLAGGHWVTL